MHRAYRAGNATGWHSSGLLDPTAQGIAFRLDEDALSWPYPPKNLPLMYKPFSGALQRCLFSAGNLVSIGFSGFALIWSSAQ
jgi:hypothetical protein